MKYLFQAIEARFNANSMLRLKGRKLYEGFEDARVNVTKPYTELNAEMVERLDTFGSDIEVWDLHFRYHAKDIRTGAADDWVDAMTDAFKDSDIKSGRFQTAGCNMVTASVPKLKDGLFDATIDFQLIFQRRINLPLVRQA